MSQTILAISFGSKKIGAAYYDEDDSKVHILHDLAEDDDFTTLNSCNFFNFILLYNVYIF